MSSYSVREGIEFPYKEAGQDKTLYKTLSCLPFLSLPLTGNILQLELDENPSLLDQIKPECAAFVHEACLTFPEQSFQFFLRLPVRRFGPFPVYRSRRLHPRQPRAKSRDPQDIDPCTSRRRSDGVVHESELLPPGRRNCEADHRNNRSKESRRSYRKERPRHDCTLRPPLFSTACNARNPGVDGSNGPPIQRHPGSE